MLRRRLRVFVLAALTIVLVGGRGVARRFLFPVQDLRALPTPAGFFEHRLVSQDGVTVRALELTASDGAPTIVHFHTNRQTAESVAGLAHALRERGLGVVLVEYRGYGRSAGRPTEEALYADAETVLAMLRSRGIGPERVVLSGQSLGSGVAAEMARRGLGAKLVLVTPYTSIPAVVEAAAPFLPARVFIDDRFETLAKASKIAIPTLVIHGDADEIVPFWMGEALTRAIPGAVMRRIPGGRHGDLFARDPDLLAAIAAHAG